MRCYFHESEAVSVCTNCGKGLCRKCTHEFKVTNKIYCTDCAKKSDVVFRNMHVHTFVGNLR